MEPTPEHLMKGLERRAQKGFNGYPLAIIAFYGPNDKTATKAVIGIIKESDGVTADFKKWTFDNGDLRKDVPTIKELGYDVVTLEATRTVWGPPKMPKNIVDIYTKAIEKVTKNAEFLKEANDVCGVKVEFRSGQRMLDEGVISLDKKAATSLVEFYKQ